MTLTDDQPTAPPERQVLAAELAFLADHDAGPARRAGL